jgi:hypothetical protein
MTEGRTRSPSPFEWLSIITAIRCPISRAGRILELQVSGIYGAYVNSKLQFSHCEQMSLTEAEKTFLRVEFSSALKYHVLRTVSSGLSAVLLSNLDMEASSKVSTGFPPSGFQKFRVMLKITMVLLHGASGRP